MGETDQLAFDLGLRPAQDREDFFASASNAAALELVDRWPDWPAAAAIIVGPQGSGKTHLTHVWQARSQAVRLSAAHLDDTVARCHDWSQALIVEDVDRGIADDRVLFHLLNSARESGGAILVTSRVAPGDLTIALPDLRSRLRALPVAVIHSPDDALCRAVLVKLFADRQLAIEPAVISYLLLHGDRSMAALTRLVAVVDDLSLALQRRVTKPVAAAALRRLADEQL